MQLDAIFIVIKQAFLTAMSKFSGTSIQNSEYKFHRSGYQGFCFRTKVYVILREYPNKTIC